MASSSRLNKRKRVVVLGAGVIGLSTAVRLAERFGTDVDVEVVADRFSPNTTSNVAGGIWSPQFTPAPKASPNQEPRKRSWATQTWQYGQAMARSPDAARAGIFHIPIYKVYYWIENQAEHWWRDVVFDYRRISDRERDALLPDTRDAYVFTTTVTDCSLFLPYLTDKLVKAGGKITNRRVLCLQEFIGECDVLVNCTGLGAGVLVPDSDVQPVRGQVLQVDAPWIHYVIEVEPASSDSSNWVYFIPRVREVVVGGTSQPGRWDTATSDDQDTKNILEGVAKFMPSLKDAEVKKISVGLRPRRLSGVRLEKETIRSGKGTIQVVHNYGHSGNGITLYWGCATEATDLVGEILGRPAISKL